ncbi:hypothetical protein Bpfe_019366 [Biomphalaria pfeifferi]|uniref:Uncharacterized protein n=1 Tax=Biomphalaria pfeifferi TaxID=112525 RepID=A0AAD8BC47_BIOPF|nr:hypothetical protein Bpfe_019366 [Biomphalaria pfeifferi]
MQSATKKHPVDSRLVAHDVQQITMEQFVLAEMGDAYFRHLCHFVLALARGCLDQHRSNDVRRGGRTATKCVI